MKNFKKVVFLALSISLLAIMVYPSLVFTQEKEITGQNVYEANCGKCHSERYASERSDDEWAVIVTHMRLRGGLTAKEARAVLEYLQDNND
jgi:cytochrome c1